MQDKLLVKFDTSIMNIPGSTKWKRRDFLKTAAAGAGGFALWSTMGGCAGAHYVRQEKFGPAVYGIGFNDHWHFGEVVNGCTEMNFDDSHLETVTLPHTVNELSWRKWDPRDWEKTWVYRRRFSVEANRLGKRFFLQIGAAMTAAKLYLNGRQIGEHVGGYLPFDIEITDDLVSGENVFAALINARFDINVPPNKPGRDPRSVDFWQPGGIYRSVELQVVPAIFISDVFAKPVNVVNPDCRVEVNCTIDAALSEKKEVSLHAVLFEGKKIKKEAIQTTTTQKGKTTVILSLDGLKDVHLWDVDDPYLYDVKVTLLIGAKAVHDYSLRIGFREARFTKKGFFLNGKRLQLFGVNRHQFYPFAGGAMPGRVQRKDVEIMKKTLNCNMVRCSHYPQSEAFFDACDELGLLAWEEAAGWGSPLGNDQWKDRAVHAVKQMICRDRNHPSIIIWGTRLNETPDDVPLYTRTRNLAHQLDNSRQTTGAMVGGKHDTTHFVQDVFSYNDYAKSKAPDGSFQPELLPPRTDLPYLVSEAVGTLSGPAKYYRRIDSVIAQQGQTMAHARVHNLAAADERYCGLLAWSGFDYPSGSGNQFDGVKYTGIIDLFREPKPGAAIYQAQVDPANKPVIIPAFYWHFSPDALPFKETQPAMVCSNCEKLEFFIDGNHFDTVMPDRKNFAHLPYPPSFINFKKLSGKDKPELRIDGYIAGSKVVSISCASDTDGDRFWVQADDDELIADGSDATRVVFRLLDKFGMPRPYATGDVSFSLSGPAMLVGDNPFAFESTGGVGAVWIRTKAAQPGEIRLEVRHPLGSKWIKINAVKQPK